MRAAVEQDAGAAAADVGRAGRIDFALGGLLAASLSPAVLVGAAVAHRVSARVLQLAVNCVLVASAVALLVKVLVAGVGSGG